MIAVTIAAITANSARMIVASAPTIVVTVVAVEIGLLTPPFGLSVYVIKSTLQDESISLGDIFRGTAPFTLMMLGVLLLLIFFPFFPS